MRGRTVKLLWYALISIATLAPTALSHAADPTSPQSRTKCITVAVGQSSRACLAPGSGRGHWFKDCVSCPEMVVVPRGEFEAGSADDEPGRAPSESRTRATIARSFAVARFAVTFDEWDACVADGGCNGYRPSDEAWGRHNRPVVNVGWQDAKAYTRWLSRKTGKSYRLPTEREREYVARAGTSTAYWWGNTIDLERANIDLPLRASRDGSPVPTASKSGQEAGPPHRTVPVDSFAANAWGLYNVHGNVWEWTSDCWREFGEVQPRGRAGTAPAECGDQKTPSSSASKATPV